MLAILKFKEHCYFTSYLYDRCEVHEIYVGKKAKRQKKKATLTLQKNVYKGDFEVGKTYYWRVDCIENHNGDKVKEKGKVWKFTVKEENTDDGKNPCMKDER